MAPRVAGVDEFGMPLKLSWCTDEMFRALGRVVVVGAIIELRMSELVEQWGRDPNDRGRSMDHLIKRFNAIASDRTANGLEVPPVLQTTVNTAKDVMEERNVAVHALRPNDDYAWSNRPDRDDSVPALEDMVDLIQRMSAVAEALGLYISSPGTFPSSDLNECSCGCGETTTGAFRPGHRAALIDKRINRLFGGDVMAFLKWVDQQHAKSAIEGQSDVG